MNQLTESDKKRLAKFASISGIIDAIVLERIEQEDKWGKQVRPMLGGEATVIRDNLKSLADKWKAINNRSMGGDAWYRILLEKVYEAVSEPDMDKMREELVQVAAVAVEIIEAIDMGTILPDSDSISKQ